MPGPKLPEYPKPMFRADVDPVYARDGKDEDKLAGEGWSAAYIPREFPKMLFWPGAAKKLVVQSKAEEQAKIEEGWSAQSEPIHYGEKNEPANLPMPGPEPGSPAAAAQNNQAAMLQQQIIEMQKMMGEQQKLINSLLLKEPTGKEPDDTEEPEVVGGKSKRK